MLIDWFTVVAQLINFFILVLLLKRFLYTPVLKAIDDRERKIKTQIQEAESQMSEAGEEQKKYLKKNETFDKERDALMEEVNEQAQKERSFLLDQARQEAKELRRQLEESLKEEKEELHHKIVEKVRKEIFVILRKILRDLASQSLEEQMTRVFLDRINNLEEEKKKQLIHALKKSSGEVLLSSVMELLDVLKKEINKTLNELSEEAVHCRFEKNEENISGINLHAGGFKLPWTIDDYLHSLEQTLDKLLEESQSSPFETTLKTASNEPNA